MLFSWYFRLSSLNRHMVRPAFSDVLNRCERVTVHQTQDRYFSKMGCYSTSSQGQMYSKRVVARYLCCGENLFLRYADWMFRGKSRFLAFAQSCGVLIKIFDLSQSFAFPKKFVLSKKAPHFHNPIISLSQSVITYCHQKNPLRVRTKLHIRLC